MEKEINKDVANTLFYKEILKKLYFLANKPTSGNLSEKYFDLYSYEAIRKYYSNIIILNESINETISSKLSVNGKEQLAEDKIEIEKAFNDLNDALAMIRLTSFIKQSSPSYIEGEDTSQKKDVGQRKLTHNMFGINDQTLKKKVKKLVAPRHLELLKKELQHYMMLECSNIVTFIFPNDSFSTISLGMTEVAKTTVNLKKETEAKRILLAKQKQNNSDLLRLVFQQLFDYEDALESVVKKFRKTTHPLPHMGFFSTSLKAYLMKLRCLEMEVLTSTYTKASVLTLRNLKERLDAREKSMDHLLTRVDHKLSNYEGLNPRFYSLLKEYAKLEKELTFFKT